MTPNPALNRTGRHAALEAWVEWGALLSYSTDADTAGPVPARYIDKIFKGANPAELPVEEISRTVLAVNPKRTGARPHDPAVSAGASGSGDSVAIECHSVAQRGRPMGSTSCING